MSVKNLTTRGQIRTRKKHRGRSNKNISRKLKINIEQGGGGRKVLTNNQIVNVLTYLVYMKMAIICLKYLTILLKMEIGCVLFLMVFFLEV